MKPQFTSPLAWEQADYLMQPALIRTIDQLRLALERCPWPSRYEEVSHPFPGHQLILTDGDRQWRVNIWDICFQVCFCNYQAQFVSDPNQDDGQAIVVEIDQGLFTREGELDWTALDQKAQQCVEQLLTSLPNLNLAGES